MKITKIYLTFLLVLITLMITIKSEAQNKSAVEETVTAKDTSSLFLKGMESYNNKELNKAKEYFKSLLLILLPFPVSDA